MRETGKKRGFTLAELLIVIAILGVLAAVAIPVFTSSLEKTRETVCLANRTMLSHEMIYEQMLGGKDIAAAEIQKMIARQGYRCPSGGDYVYNTENGVVSCTEHRDTSVSIIQSKPAQIMTLPTVVAYFNKEGKTQLDSSGPNFGPDTRKEIQDVLHLPDDNFDFRIYWSPKSAPPKIYVFEKITLEDVGNEVSVSGYRMKQENGVWIVEQSVSGSGTVRKASVDGKEYAQMNVENIAW